MAKVFSGKIRQGKDTVTLRLQSPQKKDKGRIHPITGCRVDTLMGHWLMPVQTLDSLRQTVSKYDLKQLADENRRIALEAPAAGTTQATLPYKLENGIASIGITGPITKYSTSFQMMIGGTSTLAVERAMRHAVSNPDVQAIKLYVDSPGGTFHGTGELADAIYKFSQKKPVIAFCSGVANSGAYFLASQANVVLATAQTHIGSIGVKCVVQDSSEQAAKMGVKIIPVTAGKFKADLEPGTKISPEQIARLQAEVDAINEVFVNSVVRGRAGKMTTEKVMKLEAGIVLGKAAKDTGLVDEIVDEDRASEITRLAATEPEKYLRKVNATDNPQPKPNVAPDAGTGTPAGSARQMLNAQQLEVAKTLPGAAGITVENADVLLLGVATELHRKTIQSAPPMPEAEAQRHIKLAQRELDVFVKEGKLIPDQAAGLKASMKPSMVQADGTVTVTLEDVGKVLNLNKPSGLTTEVTGANAAARQVPGGGGTGAAAGDGGEKSLDLKQVNETRILHGLKPVGSLAELEALR